MRKLSAIYKKELKAYFQSPVAYVVIGFFLYFSAKFFYMSTVLIHMATMEYVFANIIFILLLLSPILTMRLIAEEKKTGTEQLLITCPVRLSDIVLGKYLAAFTVYIIMLIITFIYPAILYYYSKIELGPVFTGYLGLLLLGGAFIAVGLFASSLTENQIIAGVIGFAMLLLLWTIGWSTAIFKGIFKKFFESLSIIDHFNNFQIGIIDTGDVFYYLSVIFIFIFLTVQVIEKRRWSKG